MKQEISFEKEYFGECILNLSENERHQISMSLSVEKINKTFRCELKHVPIHGQFLNISNYCPDFELLASLHPGKPKTNIGLKVPEAVLSQIKSFRVNLEKNLINLKNNFRDDLLSGKRKFKLVYHDGEILSGWTTKRDDFEVEYGIAEDILKERMAGHDVEGWGFCVDIVLPEEFSYAELVEATKEKVDAKKAKIEAKEKARAEKFEEAKKTGMEVLLWEGKDECDGTVVDCNFDSIGEYALPDGNTRSFRNMKTITIAKRSKHTVIPIDRHIVNGVQCVRQIEKRTKQRRKTNTILKIALLFAIISTFQASTAHSDDFISTFMLVQNANLVYVDIFQNTLPNLQAGDIESNPIAAPLWQIPHGFEIGYALAMAGNVSLAELCQAIDHSGMLSQLAMGIVGAAEVLAVGTSFNVAFIFISTCAALNEVPTART